MKISYRFAPPRLERFALECDVFVIGFVPTERAESTRPAPTQNLYAFRPNLHRTVPTTELPWDEEKVP